MVPMQKNWKCSLVMLWSMHISNVATQSWLASEEFMQNDTIYDALSRGNMVLHAPSDSSIPSLSSFFTLHFSPPYFYSLHWLDFLKQEVRSYTGEYTSICNQQKTTWCCYFPFFVRLSSLSTVLWIFSDKVLLIFTFYLIIAYFNQFSTFSSSHVTTISRPYSSSSADLSSVQLSSSIIPHQQSRLYFVIRLYIYWLFHHPLPGYPISDQLFSSPHHIYSSSL